MPSPSIKRLLIVTDAWEPQVNGVVRTLKNTAEVLRSQGVFVEFLTPQAFTTLPCPTYPEIRLSLVTSGQIMKRLIAIDPDALHIATEGPLGFAARNAAKALGWRYTTAYHTRFPEYIHARFKIPLSWSYGFFRRFHADSHAVLVPTEAVIEDLLARGFRNVRHWSRGVDHRIFKPLARAEKKAGAPPIFLYAGRLAVEKNVEAFLNLDLPGEKWVAGEGPLEAHLKRTYPSARYIGVLPQTELAELYNAADVFVFPSRTDTFGLVMVEAMACGLPVAAYPVAGPIDVVGPSGAGVLDEDLGRACLQALSIPRQAATDHAAHFTWENATAQFYDYLVPVLPDTGQSEGGLRSPFAQRARACTHKVDHDYSINDNPHKGNRGLTRALLAARHSWSGLKFAFKEESAFRQELALAGILLPLALMLDVKPLERVALIGSVLLVLIIELLNSSVEAAIDRISYDDHGLSKRAKDYGSAAVMLALALCALTWSVVIF